MTEQKDNAVARNYDVLIVGGGMVGLALACALADAEIKVGVVEANPVADISFPEPGDAFEPRVSALTLASKNFLENIGAWEGVRASRYCPFSHMQVWDAEGTGQVRFSAVELGCAELGYIVENRVILNALMQRAASVPGLEIVAPAKVAALSEQRQGARSVVLQDGRRLNAHLVVGADGAHSKIRQLAAVEVDQRDYLQKAIVTSVKVRNHHQDTAWQRFLTTGPLAFLPLKTPDSCGHYCSIVWSLDSAQADKVMAYDDAAFLLALERAFESRLGRVEAADARFQFELRQRHAKTYTMPSVALIGDAAHSIHPLAGQGVNLGMMDAAVLAEEIITGVERGLSPADALLLARYQRRRITENLMMMGLVDGFKHLFGQTAPPLRWLRSAGMSLVDQLGPIKNLLASQAAGLSGEIPKLARNKLTDRCEAKG